MFETALVLKENFCLAVRHGFIREKHKKNRKREILKALIKVFFAVMQGYTQKPAITWQAFVCRKGAFEFL